MLAYVEASVPTWQQVLVVTGAHPEVKSRILVCHVTCHVQ